MLTEIEKMRDRVALEHGFKLYHEFAAKQVAGILKVDLSTIKRWTKKGLIRGKRKGERGVQYLGIEIADVILRGTRPWQDDIASENSNSETTGSISETAPQLGTGAGARVDAQSALRLARQTLKKQSNG